MAQIDKIINELLSLYRITIIALFSTVSSYLALNNIITLRTINAVFASAKNSKAQQR